MTPSIEDAGLNKPWRDATTKTQRKLHTAPTKWSMDYGLLTLVIRKGNDGMWWAACDNLFARRDLNITDVHAAALSARRILHCELKTI